MPASSRGPTRPAGGPASLIDHLNAQAPKKPINASVGITKYFRSAELLLRQAASYRTSHNEEQLYVMLMRYASLLVETIPCHKDFNKADGAYKEALTKLQHVVFPELETIKASIRKRDIPEPVARSINRPSDVVRLTSSPLPQLNWGPAARLAVGAGAAASPDIDDLLDILESGPGPSSAAASQRAGVTQGQGVPPPPPPPPPSGPHSRQLQPSYQPKYLLHGGRDRNTHALFYSPASGNRAAAAAWQQGGPPAGASGYPSLDSLSMSTSMPALRPGQPLAHVPLMGQPSAGPPLGPQEVAVYGMTAQQAAGAPGSCSDPHPSLPGPPPPEAGLGGAGPKELAKRASLRDVHVSLALMEQFLAMAAANTARGVETCGILAASLSANDSVFTISTLIIPKQTGTSDTVEMYSEEDVLTVHLERELYPLGWIHTHPTQTCFLSSVDVHTQCSYQTMLDEAVAIVMAPTDTSKRLGIFRLTTPGGLTLVQNCERRGFHTHPDTHTGQELYELCGHVYLNDRVQHDVIDLR